MNDLVQRAMMRKINGLPPGAILCESIYSSGYSDFINTSLIPLKNMSFEAEVAWVKDNSAASTAFGYYISSKRYTPIRVVGSRVRTVLELGYNNYHSSNIEVPLYRLMKYKAVIKPTEAHFEVYDEEGNPYTSGDLTYDESSFVPSLTIGLFGRKSSASAIETGSFRGMMGMLTIYGDDHYGVKLKDYVPIYLDGQYGYWDLVNKEFLTIASLRGFSEAFNTNGFTANVKHYKENINYPGNLIDNRGTMVTRKFQIPSGCTQLRFDTGRVDSSDLALMFFKEDKTYLTYWNSTERHRIVSVQSGGMFVRLSFPTINMNTSYIYDVTHGQYIWRGANASIPE